MEQLSPLVSVIIPSFNHAKFLTKRLSSIIEQSYTNLEIIILDDASQDQSQLMLERFSKTEPRVRHLIFSQKNSGLPVHQWIKGVALAKGKYVWIAESDDYNDKNFLSSMVNVMQRYPQSGIAYCSSMMVDSAENSIGMFDLESPLFSKDLWQQDFVLKGKSLVEEYFMARNIIPNANAALFNRDLLAKHMNSGKSLAYLADWMIYVNIAFDSDIAYINRPLNFYRIHDKSTTRSYSIVKHRKILREKIKILKNIKEKLGNSSDFLKKSVAYMMINRNKFRLAEKVFEKLTADPNGPHQVAFYAYNDLAKYLMERDQENIIPCFIIDRGKAGSQYNGVPILSLDDADLTQIKTVVVLSFRYSAEMKAALESKKFIGNIIVI